MPQSPGNVFTADPLSFVVRHQLWDANVEDHSDQGVSIDVAADVRGKHTTLLRFNCFDLERSYVYGPENPELTTPGRVGGGMGVHCRMDPIIDGNPIGWSIGTLGRKLPQMLERAGYKEIADTADLSAVRDVLPDVEACARETFIAKRNVVKHNRGTEVFAAGNILNALAPLAGENERIGGSRAQHDLIEFTLLKAYLNADRLEEARLLLDARRPEASSVPVTASAAVH
jgi:hypothetical protein